MGIDSNKALVMIQQQLKELDVIYQDTMEGSLNTVSGTERIAKWRVRTIALLTESVGEKEAQEGKVAVRRQGKGDLGVKTIDEFISEVRKEIKDRTPNP